MSIIEQYKKKNIKIFMYKLKIFEQLLKLQPLLKQMQKDHITRRKLLH